MAVLDCTVLMRGAVGCLKVELSVPSDRLARLHTHPHATHRHTHHKHTNMQKHIHTQNTQTKYPNTYVQSHTNKQTPIVLYKHTHTHLTCNHSLTHSHTLTR